VVEGDIESDIDTERLRKQNISASQINTFGACHLDAPLLHNAVHAMEFAKPGILFMWKTLVTWFARLNFPSGKILKLLQVCVTDGSDKPYKYPLAFEKADVIILSKIDLLPYVDFDEEFFMKGLRHLNPEAPFFKVNGKTGAGYDQVAAWLSKRASAVTGAGPRKINAAGTSVQ
jgi:hydrogenase nickel incorporation protein HypB